MDERSARSLRRLHGLICIVGLGFFVLGFVQQASQPALPADLLREPLAYPEDKGVPMTRAHVYGGGAPLTWPD